jgi:hydrogenase-4 component B
LHVWNHALFKSLLFLCAGSVIRATQTREIDQLGGLAKTMPYTALFFLIGAVAICGLPPLNGLVSEFVIYLGLFGTRAGAEGPLFLSGAFAACALALIGALAAACFVKVCGAVFLGTARSERARQAHESPASMIGPMAVLAALCFVIGLAPLLVSPLLDSAAIAWAPELRGAEVQLAQLAPLAWIGSMGIVLLAALFVGSMGLSWRLRQRNVEQGATWGCGYIAPTARMQYTSSSFAQMLVGLFGWALRPRASAPNRLSLFPQKTSFHSDVPDTVLEKAVLPTFRFAARICLIFRVFQRGNIQAYLLYIFLALLTMLLWR